MRAFFLLSPFLLSAILFCLIPNRLEVLRIEKEWILESEDTAQKKNRLEIEDFTKKIMEPGEVKILETSGHIRFLISPPGPCSCPVKSIFECSDNLTNLLQIERDQVKRLPIYRCDPAAGCSIGTTVFHVDCGEKNKSVDHVSEDLVKKIEDFIQSEYERKHRIIEELELKLRAERSKAIMITKAKLAYVRSPLATCNCPMDNSSFKCSDDLEMQLDSVRKLTDEKTKTICRPTTGCENDQTTFYVDCTRRTWGQILQAKLKWLSIHVCDDKGKALKNYQTFATIFHFCDE